MSNEASQEMTLQQWCDRLGPNHRASKELRELQQQAKEHVSELQRRCNELLSERRGIRYLVHDFHSKFGYPVHTVPHVPDDAAVRFRLKLISEEFFELLDATLGEFKPEAWQRKSAEDKVKGLIDQAPIVVNMPELADAMADLDYVVEGTRLTFGIDGWPVLLEVQRANMSKAPSHLASADRAKVDFNVAKTPKPEGWTPPNIKRVLEDQGWQSARS